MHTPAHIGNHPLNHLRSFNLCLSFCCPDMASRLVEIKSRQEERKRLASIQYSSGQVPAQPSTESDKRPSPSLSRGGDTKRSKKTSSSSALCPGETAEWMEQHWAEVADKGRIAVRQERIASAEGKLKAAREELSKNSFLFLLPTSSCLRYITFCCSLLFRHGPVGKGSSTGMGI